MSDAPERIWIEDERSIGGGIWIHDGEKPYSDPYVNEYVRADLHAALEAQLAQAKEALEKLRTTAAVLQQTALGCAANHYGEDFTIHGTPGWLLDTQVDIDRARATLANLEKYK